MVKNKKNLFEKSRNLFKEIKKRIESRKYESNVLEF
jgi:hypothetical protein